MAKTDQLTVERARELFALDPDTGILTRRASRGGVLKGSVAGGQDCSSGYNRVHADNIKYSTHRVVWLIHYGEMPDKAIDHKNKIKHDNRILNLRLASPTQNAANKHAGKNSLTGIKGVYKRILKSGRIRYRACIHDKGVTKHLGTFDTAEIAEAYYLGAALSLWGPFASEGRN